MELLSAIDDFSRRTRSHPASLLVPASFVYLFKLNREMRVHGIKVVVDNFILKDSIILRSDTGLSKSYKLLCLRQSPSEDEVNKFIDDIVSGIDKKYVTEENDGN